jgi:predicted ATPase/class 3 adenylate cyclase/tRNA A-37 threonylcarbamoyl transferase component Bud32
MSALRYNPEEWTNCDMEILGYRIGALIHEGHFSVCHRARCLRDHEAVVIKQLAKQYPRLYGNARLKQEFDIMRMLDSPAVLGARELLPLGDTFALIVEDFGGAPLGAYIKPETCYALETILDIGLTLAEALEAIHAKGITHKDIKPQNILRNPKTGEVKLIDFSIASMRSVEEQSLRAASLLEGTLGYMSPEQTTRMNRAVDYRTDFYSLGVVLFELLSGRPPFVAEDPLELLHQHIARLPPPLPGCPAALAAIVSKLLAKSAEDRYQSAFGLKRDLLRCRESLSTIGRIEIFDIGKEDLTGQFRWPQKLYGRADETQMLLQHFERFVSHKQTELLLVKGHSGSGKSVLIQELHRPLVAHRGYFVEGKFDQFRRDIPYSAWVQALSEFMRQLLGESPERIEQWRALLKERLGANGGVITEVIPQAELLMGEQPPVVPLGPTEAQNRFKVVFLDFIAALTQDQPLVIFLDDLQWADSGTLRLLELLMTAEQSPHLLMIGAYRDEEVDAAHPLQLTLKALEPSERLTTLPLSLLTVEHITELLTDMFGGSQEALKALAKRVVKQTAGNPFFVRFFLGALHRRGLLRFDSQAGRWDWDLDHLEAVGFTDNVVALMSSRLTELPEPTQRALQIAACLGHQFDLHALANLLRCPLLEVANTLESAIEAGILVAKGETLQHLMILQNTESNTMDAERLAFPLRFAHDRIQQAAYQALSQHEKASTHLRIGQELRATLDGSAFHEQLFEIVNHFNLGLAELDAAHRSDLMVMNRQAGQKAKASSAYGAAIAYLETALGLHDADDLLQRQMQTELAEAAYLSGDLTRAYTICNELLPRTQEPLERVKLYLILQHVHVAENRLGTALDTGLDALDTLGLRLPRKPKQQHIVLALIQTKWAIGRRKPSDFLQLPEMRDPASLAMMSVLAQSAPCAYQSRPDMLPIIVFAMVRLSVMYGNTGLSSYAYTLYGMAMNGVLGRLEEGLAYGELALEVMERFDAYELHAKNFGMYNFFLRHWREPLRNTLKPMLELAHIGSEVGDLEYQTYNYFFYCQARFVLGDNLEILEEEFRGFLTSITRLKQEVQRYVLTILLQVVHNLRGRSPERTLLQGEIFDARSPEAFKFDSGSFYVHFYQAVLHYIFNEPDAALRSLHIASKHLDAVLSMNVVPLFHYYRCLIALSAYPQASGIGRLRLRWIVSFSRRKLGQWATYAPSNQNHRRDLVDAEIARVFGRHASAQQLYQRAITQSRKEGYHQDLAIACERASEYYGALGAEDMQRYSLEMSLQAYRLWGAKAKVELLEQQTPQENETQRRSSFSNSKSTNDVLFKSNLNQTFDLAAVLKASQALSSEIEQSRLLDKLMQIVIENAGAERGLLLRSVGGEWLVEAKGQLVPQDTTNPSDKNEALFMRAVRYVARTREALVLSEATQDKHYASDPYVIEHKPRSILCAPLMNKGQLDAILYLENNLASGAFTPERLEILHILSAQAVISLENARLYSNIQAINRAYERFVPQQFLSHLSRESITDVQLGDQIQREMTILFSDIRDFTSISEGMSPAENFQFVNEYLRHMEPQITHQHGFIDKYIGDAIMALFPHTAEDAIRAALEMLRSLEQFNEARIERGEIPIRIGIGLHTGLLMLGIVGGPNRMDGTVISDAVNLASRVESLTKHYGASLLITEATRQRLQHPIRVLRYGM